MVRFEKDRFIIDIYTGFCPIEDYLELHEELSYVFSLMNQENMPANGLPGLACLLSAMQPDYELAKKMTDKQ